MMEYDDFFDVYFEVEEWEELTPERRKYVMNKLALSTDPLAYQMLQAVTAADDYVRQQTEIDFEATYKMYYGDEDGRN